MKVSGRASATSRSVSTPLTGVALREKGPRGVSAAGSGRPLEDHIEISPETADFIVIKSAVSAVPDIREDVISAIKSAIDKGTYRAPAEMVAEKIIRESLMNAALLT